MPISQCLPWANVDFRLILWIGKTIIDYVSVQVRWSCVRSLRHKISIKQQQQQHFPVDPTQERETQTLWMKTGERKQRPLSVSRALWNLDRKINNQIGYMYYNLNELNRIWNKKENSLSLYVDGFKWISTRAYQYFSGGWGVLGQYHDPGWCSNSITLPDIQIRKRWNQDTESTTTQMTEAWSGANRNYCFE